MLGFLMVCVRETPLRHLERAATTESQAALGAPTAASGLPLKHGPNSQTQDLKSRLPRIKH